MADGEAISTAMVVESCWGKEVGVSDVEDGKGTATVLLDPAEMVV